MGFLKDITTGIFGGTDKTGLKDQRKENWKAQKYIQEQADLARQDVLDYWPKADEKRDLGYLLALGLMGQAIPEQSRMFQQGNVAAQNQLLAAMPQFQNAILGLPYDNNAFRSVAIEAAAPPMFSSGRAFQPAVPGEPIPRRQVWRGMEDSVGQVYGSGKRDPYFVAKALGGGA